jgi:hypothetical protein
MFWRVRLTRVTRKHTTGALRNVKQGTESDANCPWTERVFAVDALGVLVP